MFENLDGQLKSELTILFVPCSSRMVLTLCDAKDEPALNNTLLTLCDANDELHGLRCVICWIL